MVRPKKQSKRMPASKRYKIQRKVKEHLRKTKKEAKKHGGHRRLKKDPGIPNLFPFKEQVLRQAEERKLKQEEDKQKRKQQRQKLVNKKRNLESLQQDAAKRAKEFERKAALKESMENLGNSGAKVEGSLKAYYKEFKKVVDNADVILEVLDARDPIGCRCPQVEQAVLSSGPNKKLVLVLNKIDLVPKSIVEKWLKHLRNEFPTVAFKASTQAQKQHLSHSKVPVALASSDLLSGTACVGADMIMKLLGNYCRNKDIKTSVTVGIVATDPVIGNGPANIKKIVLSSDFCFPNVGKSSIINSLKRSRACTVGATPGVTRSMQEVQLDKHVKLLDSPGIVMDSGGSDASVILRNCVKIETIDDPVPAVEAILRRCNKQQVMEKYSVADYKDVHEFLAHLARRLGKLKKGGVADVRAAGKTVLRDWNSGKIVFYTHPPEQSTLPTHISADIVSEWSKEFDLAALLTQEADDLKGLKSTDGEEAMVLEPSNPTEAASFDEYRTEMDSEDEDDMEYSEDDDDDEEEEEDSEGDDDVECMEDEEDQLQDEEKKMTVVVEKSKKLSTKTQKVQAALKPHEINEFNRQTNQAMKKAFKKQKKEARRIEKGAMADSDDDYNFDEDFH